VTGRTAALFFLATFLTTSLAGSWLAGADPFTDPVSILEGLPFAASLLAILGAHEMGHFITSRRHGVKATWPLFIPAPTPVGTFGALIRIKSAIPDRRALIRIGAAGPLAGFAVAVPLTVVGLALSRVEAADPTAPAGGVYLGSCLVFRLLELLVLGDLGDGSVLLLHPVGIAAWFGFFVTAMNLIPIGQLDGGHILYALAGRRQGRASQVLLLALVPLGFLWPGWFLWGGLLAFMGYRHPPVLFEMRPLPARERILGFLSLAVLIVTFMPLPFIF